MVYDLFVQAKLIFKNFAHEKYVNVADGKEANDIQEDIIKILWVRKNIL
jgi:hypothetical protein